MYIPPRFVEPDLSVAAKIIAANAFGHLVTTGEAAPAATPLPFLYRAEEGAKGTLYGHVARANPQWKAFDGRQKALAVFLGPHGYISPNWYQAREAVPTWNYVAVQATGAPRLLEDPEARVMLDRLSMSFEDPAAPWTMAAQNAEFIRAKIKGIAGFAMPVDEIAIKVKLGQDRSRADSLGAAAALRRAGNATLAQLMETAARPENS